MHLLYAGLCIKVASRSKPPQLQSSDRAVSILALKNNQIKYLTNRCVACHHIVDLALCLESMGRAGEASALFRRIREVDDMEYGGGPSLARQISVGISQISAGLTQISAGACNIWNSDVYACCTRLTSFVISQISAGVTQISAGAFPTREVCVVSVAVSWLAFGARMHAAGVAPSAIHPPVLQPSHSAVYLSREHLIGCCCVPRTIPAIHLPSTICNSLYASAGVAMRPSSALGKTPSMAMRPSSAMGKVMSVPNRPLSVQGSRK